jgi:phospholipid/cholesterol/gamma-HCH transport system permease protein
MFDFSVTTFFTSVQTFFNLGEISRGLLKSLVFGGFTALIGVHVGFRTVGVAEVVWYSTVLEFTISAASILVIDALFGVIL